MIRVLCFLVFAVVLSGSRVVSAQDPSRPQLENLTQTGKLFTVTVTPADRVVRIHLAGKPALKFDPKSKELEVTLINQGRRIPLRVSRESESMYVAEPPAGTKSFNLEVKAKHKGQSEDFQFSIP